MNIQQANGAAKLQGQLEKRLCGLIDEGFELGLQAAVYFRGELIVDLALGRTTPPSAGNVTPETIFPVCSTGKGILATLVHILAERGLLDYDHPIASYWPEFAVNGKGDITLRQALAHLSGLPDSPPFRSREEICDFDRACTLVAEMSPSYPPGSRMQYHARTFGWIVGGVAQRVGGCPLPELLAREIGRPLGIESSLFFGTDDEAETRVSSFEPQPSSKEQVTTAARDSGSLEDPLMDFVNLPEVRRSCMPAVNGVMSARAIAKVYASMIGEVDGVRIIPESRLEKAATGQVPAGGTPECFGHNYGLGYALKGPLHDMGALFGHGGAGGSEGMANRRSGFAFGLTKNRMDTHLDAPDHTNWIVMQEILAALGDEGDGGFYHKRV